MNFIEPLESRIAPALLAPSVDPKGVLHLMHSDASGTAEHVVVTETAANSFKVEDTLLGNPDLGTFNNVKSIGVVTSTFDDTIDLKFSHDGLAGNLDITTGGGKNTITLESVDFVSGSIAGKVTIRGGAGDDTVKINNGVAIASPVLFAGGDGIDAFIPNGAYLAKKLTLDSVENITTQNALNPVVIGGMLVENDHANAVVTFILNQITTIAGALTYCGSASVPDNVTLNGNFTGGVKLMLLDGTNNVTTAGTFMNGLSVTGGNDEDTILFNSVSLNSDPTKPPFITANVAGSVSLKLGNGTNTVTFQDGSFFAKDVSVVTGTGMDTVNMTKGYFAKNLNLSLGNGVNELARPVGAADNFVGSTFKYIGGIGGDTLDLDRLVAGNINVVLGNGTNSVTGAARIIGKSASFTGGSGMDTISIALGSTGGSLSAKLGAGADSFTFLGGALASAKLDGGADNDTLTGITLLPAKQKIVGFETKS